MTFTTATTCRDFLGDAGDAYRDGDMERACAAALIAIAGFLEQLTTHQITPPSTDAQQPAPETWQASLASRY